jgi:pyruvate formate-lyase activating enzyme-like uncharacterized protein
VIGGEAKGVTASIERNYSDFRNINEMNFQEDNWRIKMLKSLQTQLPCGSKVIYSLGAYRCSKYIWTFCFLGD